MAFAVCLLFDAEITNAIGKHWTQIADSNISRSMPDLNYPPHVTLAVYDTLNVDDATAALDRVFAEIDALNVDLTSVKTFEVGSGVLYAALAPSCDLIKLHANGHHIARWRRMLARTN